MNIAPDLVRLDHYREPDFEVETIDLAVDLDAQRTVVTSRLLINRRPNAGARPLRLDGRALDLVSIAMDGISLGSDRFLLDEEGLTLFDPPPRFVLETVSALSPSANTTGQGLFEVGGNLATQCEAEGFRRITYFPDRPDIMARYRVTLRADPQRYPVLLSNGERVETGRLSDGRHWAVWEDPFPKPSYVFAMVAGDFGSLRDRHVTASGRTVSITLYADHEDIDRCGFAMAVLKRSLEWDEETFGLEYDLSTFNVVALSGWAGAMENKGLNLHEAHGVVADPRTNTDDDFIIIERILAHEQFHNWTGNRVTCRDWFQLSLKEGLTRFRDQLYITEKMGAGAWRIETVKTLRRNQFPEDDGPIAHPVKPTAYAEVRNFYTATIYEKGAEVVRMLVCLLGWPTFRRGFDLYISRHDGQAVTTEEFIRAMEDASGRDLRQFRRWYSQGGRPRVAIEGHYDPDARQYRLDLRQTCRTLPGGVEPEPFHIPITVGLVGSDGQPLDFRHGGRRGGEATLELTEASQSFVLDDVAERPTPSLLRGFSAPVTLIADLQPPDLLLLMRHDSDPFARWDAAQALGVKLIRSMAAGRSDPALEVGFVGTFEALIGDDRIDDLLKSQLLTLPDLPVLDEGLDRIDLDGLVGARTALRQRLASHLRSALLGTYHARADRGDFRSDFAGVSRRRLKNACLELLVALGDDEGLDLALNQVETGQNMTDQFEALSCLVHTAGARREEALDRFYRQWREVPAVIDKWFMAQALDRGPDAVRRVLALSGHPDLAGGRIPRAVAFYGSFFRQNRVSFHDPSGAGYVFLADRLLQMDALGRPNSRFMMVQIAQWRRYDLNRQRLMRSELERVAATPGISPGLMENVASVLAAPADPPERTPVSFPSP